MEEVVAELPNDDQSAYAWLPRGLREGGGVARRIPTLTERLRELWSRYVVDEQDRPGWGDVWAVLLLAAMTIYLVSHDGGRPRGASFAADGFFQQYAGLAPIIVLALMVLVTSIGEVARAPGLTRWILLGWSVGPLIALLFGGTRDGWVRSFAALAIAVPTFLAARRIWRRTWGPKVLGTIVVVGGLFAWGFGLMLWMSSVNIRHWPLLSWHNQTATLMGVYVLVGSAIAWTSRGWIRGVGLMVAVLCGSGLWLSTSRGAFLLTLLALIVALAFALRTPQARHSLALSAIAVLLIVPVTLIVAEARVEIAGPAQVDAESSDIADPGAERGLLDRGTNVANLTMRFDYWNGAVAMFRSEPLVGTGPGSFARAAPPYLQPNFFPTLSTHNEYLEVLGTMGLAGAIPVWAATLGVAWLVLRVLRRPDLPTRARVRPEESGLTADRMAGRIAAVGALTLLGLHAGMDLDWLWPLLLGAAAIAAGVLHADLVATPEPTRAGRGIATVAIVAAVLLAVVTGVGVVVQRTSVAPWDLGFATQQTLRSVEGGDLEDARAALQDAQRWNPGAYEVATTSALVAYVDGSVPASEVAASTDPLGVRFPVQVQVASVLLDAGEVDAAEGLLTNLRPHLAARPRGEQAGRQASYLLELAVAEARGGCDAVHDVWDPQLRGRIERDGLDPDRVARAWSEGRGDDCPIG